MARHPATVPIIPSVPASEVQTVVDGLCRFSGVRRIWLFGGLIHRPQTADFRSDLDIAVEGLPGRDHARAWALLDAKTKLPIDLVRLEEAPVLLREEIIAKGRLVYEADS